MHGADHAIKHTHNIMDGLPLLQTTMKLLSDGGLHVTVVGGKFLA